jgi:uncharacterized protein YecE (DUF72 family)
MHIGTGGWAHFLVPGEPSLEAYAKVFDFVEVNTTFYEIPELHMVRRWRQKVSPDFQFSVRCHKDMTYRYMLQPTQESLALYERMIEICDLLRAQIIHIQIPSFLRIGDREAQSIRDLFSTVYKNPRIALEIRRPELRSLPESLLRVMSEMNMIHCVDVSVENPAIESDVLYARLFGPGESNIYQFTDDEMRRIDDKAENPRFEKSILAFHGVKMYKDAARFKSYKTTGRFPNVTGHTGIESLRLILTEDAKFPASKEDLIGDQGWKIIDLTEEKRVHASSVLTGLPDRIFESVEDVVLSLARI